MPVATYALTGDFSGLVGEVSSIRATVTTNSLDGGWVNDVDNTIVLGGTVLAVGADGKFTVTLPTSTGTGLQYQVTAEFTDGSRERKTWQSGWFSLTAAGDLADLANNSSLRVTATLGDQLAARIDGYQDHGDVSGVLTVDPAIGTHVLNATGSLLVTLGAAPDGRIVTLYVVSGASSVTVDGITGLTLTDGSFASFVHIRGAWVLASAGGATGPTDTTPPSAVTGLTATGGSQQISASWTAATDAESTVRYYWRVWLTSGGATGTWTMTTGTSFTKTGIATAGNYTVEVYSSSSGGSTAPVTASATITAPPATLTETFTRTDGASMAGVTSTTGGYTWGLDSNNVTMFSAQSSAGTVTGNKYAISGNSAITANFPTSNCVITADYDVTAAGAPKIAAAIAGTTGSNAVNVIVNSSGVARLYLDQAAHIAEATVALTGTLEVRYDGSTVTVKVNGTTVITQGSVTRTGTLVGVAAAGSGWVDNVTVVPL